jgi:hypothetical protein
MLKVFHFGKHVWKFFPEVGNCNVYQTLEYPQHSTKMYTTLAAKT